jgi:uncharacterized protein
MLLDLSRIRGASEHLDRTYEPEALALKDDEFRLVAPVHLLADVHKDARKVRVTGRVTTTLESACSRCLDAFPVPVDAKFDLLYLPAGEGAAGESVEEGHEIRDEDAGLSFYRDDTIDLGEIMREQCYLALPMKPLCRDECRGLCPVCGINRNREHCTCQANWQDPRLDALRKWRDERA